ncbi:MAG: helix-turn-helix domain-containing protein [Verrucomicrobiota bacterium]|jgi:hypothetical protein
MKTLFKATDEAIANNLLLHPDQIGSATDEDMAALENYVLRKQWKSLYRRNRRLYLIMGCRASYLQLPLAILLRPLQAMVVKQERTRMGWSRNQLAKRCRLTVSVIRSVERSGAAKLTLPGIWRLSSVLDLYRQWSDGNTGGTT